MTYPTKYRQIALKKLESGKTIRAVAIALEVSTRTIQNWKKDHSIKKTRDKKPVKIDNELLREDVELYPDAYHHERAYRFNCTYRGIEKALKRIGITKKKEFKPSES